MAGFAVAGSGRVSCSAVSFSETRRGLPRLASSGVVVCSTGSCSFICSVDMPFAIGDIWIGVGWLGGESSSTCISVSACVIGCGRGSLPTTRGVDPLSCGDNSSSPSSCAGAAVGVSRTVPDCEADDVLGCPFGSTLGVAGPGSVDLDRLDIDGRDATDASSTLSVAGVFLRELPGDARICDDACGGVRLITVDLAKTVSRTVLVPSSNIDNSSGTLSCSSRISGTVPTTLPLFSMERTACSRSGLSSSSAPSSAPGCAFGEPRFLLPNCGVTVSSFGVLLRLEALLRWSDALLCRCAEPFAARGVLRAGVRRGDG